MGGRRQVPGAAKNRIRGECEQELIERAVVESIAQLLVAQTNPTRIEPLKDELFEQECILVGLS